MRTRAPFFRVVAGLTLLIGSALGASVSCSLVHAWCVDARWSAVPGTLLDARVREEERWRPLGRRETTREPVVFYTYRVDGVEYEGCGLVAFDPRGLDLADWKISQVEALPRAPVGVEVRVDPGRPGSSVLRSGLDPALGGGLLGIAGGLLALGVLLWRASSARSGIRPRSVLLSGTWIAASLAVFAVRLWLEGGQPWGPSLGAAACLVLALLLGRSRASGRPDRHALRPGVVPPREQASSARV